MDYFFQFLPNLGKLIVATGFEKLPNSNKLPNLVTLIAIHLVRSSKLEIAAVWPDAGIKSNPNFPIVAQKVTKEVFYLKSNIH